MQAIPQTKEELYVEFRALAEKLEKIGLSPYEARAYIALIAHGYGNAETIAETAQIPRTSAYKILRSLETKGFAIATQGRPQIYKPEPPSKIYENFKTQLEETCGKLEMLYEVVREKGMPQLIFTIADKAKVIEKIGELMDKSTDTIILSTPSFSELRNALDKKIRNVLKREVKFSLITAPGQGVPYDDMNVIRRKGLLATDIVCDNEQALIAASDLSACGYTDNELLAEHLQRFLEILIEHVDS
ncbi:MAG: TrmB family transcriptional regulator [Thermoplasmata archaeon]|nr:TrmB family transcriptional regulator [Thermoplasmata archaeon]